MHQTHVPTHEQPVQKMSESESNEGGISLSPPAFQLKASAEATPPPAQQKSAEGGMPSDLVNGFAATTGHDLSNVNVHYNSNKPAEVGALAYAQGNDVHLGAGQEKHLAHEAAHIVQQREGRVKPTTQVSGMPVNDNPGLESEADSMGAKAMQMKADAGAQSVQAAGSGAFGGPIQRYTVPIEEQAPASAMTIQRFIELVEAEEAKYPPAEQMNTQLMISRIRKIFYGSSGWDEHLIPGAASVQSPYAERREEERERRSVDLVGPNFDMVDTENYPVDPATNARPTIYNNQEVRLADGTFCDLGHVFAGLDAHNHRQQVDGPGTLNIDNLAGVTWTGDLGSALAEIQIDYVNNDRLPTNAEIQGRIDKYAPAQDMLGNIDAYAIAAEYAIDASSGGQKVSAILRHFYLGAGVATAQSRRYTNFSTMIGLTGWNGSGWTNEAAMVERWTDDVNDAAALYLGAGADWGIFGLPGFAGFVAGMSTNAGAAILIQKFFNELRTLRATEAP